VTRPVPTRRWPPVLALLLSALLAALLGGCRAAPDRAAPQLAARADVTGVTVTLSGAGVRRGDRATLTLFTPAGAVRLPGRAAQGGQLVLTAPYVRAGLIPFEVQYAGHRLRGELRRAPGAPVTPLTLKVGARGVRVSQVRPPALVLHPLDAQGNVTDLPVDTVIRRPDGVTLRRRVTPTHLTAWTFLPPGRVTGLLRVVATTGDAAGEVGEVDVLPGPARSLRGDRGAYRDIRDALGNPVTPDESLTVTARDGDWNVEVPLTPVEGRARSPAPLPPGARVQAEELR